MHWSDFWCLVATVCLAVVVLGPLVWRDWKKDEEARATGPFAYPEEETWTL